MADGDVSLKYKLLGEDAGASRAMDKVGKSAEHLHKTMTAVGVALGTVAVGGVVAFGAALFRGVKDAEAYQTLQLKTQAVLKSTGDVAGTSVKQVQDLAGSLESLSGVDETLIINSQNVLLTFTGVRNEVGKGNDIFTQGTKAALDLSVAMGEDLQSATVQVGKALNDPIKGMTALQRVGVTFTAAQKDQVAAMVKSGDTMGAQKLILHELGKEFGGAAKAAGAGFGGSLARLQDLVGDTFRSLGMKLLPTLTGLTDWLTTKGIPKVIEFGTTIGEKLSGWISTGAAAVRDNFPKIDWAAVLGSAQAVGAKIAGVLLPAATAVFNAAKTWGSRILDGINTGLSQGNWGPLGATIGTGLSLALASLASGGAQVAAALSRWIGSIDWLAIGKSVGAQAIPFVVGFVNSLFDGLFTVAKEHPMDLVLFIAAFIPIGKLATAFGPLREAITHLPLGEWFLWVLDHTAAPVFDAIKKFLGFIFGAFREGFAAWFPETASKFGGFFKGLVEDIGIIAKWAVEKARDFVYGIAHGMGQATGGVVKAVFDLIADMVRPFVNAGKWLVHAGQEAIDGLVKGWDGGFGSFLQAVGELELRLINKFTGAGKWLFDAGRNVIHGLIDGIENAAGALWVKVSSIANGIKDKFASVLSIFSPSRVMRDEIGKMIPLGIAEGMQAGSGAIYNVAANLVPTGPSAYGVGASRPTGASGGGGTHIHLNLQSGFVGSPDQLATALSDVIQRAKSRGLNLSFA